MIAHHLKSVPEKTSAGREQGQEQANRVLEDVLNRARQLLGDTLASSEVARAFVKEARVDLRSARLLRDGGGYSRAVAACQQAVEKAVKALLALKGVIVLEHQVADRLVAVFPR